MSFNETWCEVHHVKIDQLTYKENIKYAKQKPEHARLKKLNKSL